MKFYYKRNLPHIIPDNSIFFITSRLVGSLPKNVILDLKNKYLKQLGKISGFTDKKLKREMRVQLNEQYHCEFDEALHKLSNGPFWLEKERIAGEVWDALHYRDKKVYDLFACTIMPNHIHIIIKPIVDSYGTLSYNKKNAKKIGRVKPSEYILGDIMESLKRFTAINCNKILNKSGVFWQHENYDHVIRNYNELIEKIEYVLNNSVKAGLVEKHDQWEWNYYNPNLL